MSVISSLIPVISYFVLRDYGVDGKYAALGAFALAFSSLFQNLTFLYTFDSLSTLLFTLAFYSLTRSIRDTGKRFVILAIIFYCLLFFTKYPPAAWLLAVYFFVILFMSKGNYWLSKRSMQLMFVTILSFLFVISLYFGRIIGVANIVFYGWNASTVPYMVGTFWDLFYVFGWSPYVVLAIMSYRFLRSEEKDVVGLMSLLVILLAFLTLGMWDAVTRRVIQVVPILFGTTVSYSYKHYGGVGTILVILNLSWWGIIALIP